MKGFRVLLIVTVVTLLLAACGGDESASSEEKSTIKVGTSPGPYSELFLDAIKPIMERDVLENKTADMTALLRADIASVAESIDLNVGQHTADYSHVTEEKGANLIKLTTITTLPTGLCHGKKST